MRIAKVTIIMIALFLLVPGAALADRIVLAGDEWPPFNNVPQSGAEGYMVDVARAVFEPQGIEVDYILAPWERALMMAQAGKISGVIGASKTDAAGFVFPDEELAQNKLAFFVKKGNPWRFEGHDSVNNVRLAVVSGYDYGRWLNVHIIQNRNNNQKVQIMHGERPLEKNIRKLLNNRVDVVVDNEATIRYVAERMEVLEMIESAGNGKKVAYVYIAFSPDDPKSSEYARLLSEGIVRLRAGGELQKILEKYHLKDWK